MTYNEWHKLTLEQKNQYAINEYFTDTFDEFVTACMRNIAMAVNIPYDDLVEFF